ncbi:MAG TPA: transporter [Desulfurivibrionaceae bacterium]|nr:transporter [Desulfurivibrionaceae bacterium]
MKMKMQYEVAIALFCGALLLTSAARAAHPLVTDDAGTMGTGNTLIEFNGQYDHDDYEGVKTKTRELEVAVTYGLTETVDFVVAVPYSAWSTRSEEEGKLSEDGIGDTSMEFKWRFYEQEGLSLAVKPGMSLPTGDDDESLGAGKATYQLYFVGTQEVEPWAFHLNLAYIRSNNTADERENIWHASLASDVAVTDKLHLVANIGTERNPAKGEDTHPAFILGGLVYSLTEHCDIDFGVKAGLNHAEPDYSLLAGVAFTF